MPKVLIVSNNQDTHARTVFECLRKKGITAIRWHPEEFIIKQKVIHKLTPSGEHLLTIQDKSSVNLKEVDVVWYRRPRPLRLPKNIEWIDKKFIQTENNLHFKSLWLTLGENSKWINPFSSFDKSNSKILQLRVATKVGLTIPDTVITNDKNTIIEFVNNNPKQIAIYKSFSQAVWEDDTNLYGCYSTVINVEMLASDADMALTPVIYQKVIEKRFEVRAIFFGNESIAVKILCDGVDWRYIKATVNLNLTSFILPEDIQRKCILLMQHLNIVFGCFDFIVTSQDEFVFLEVNEMGQFLWIEQILPELKLLNKFCDFILAMNNNILMSDTAQEIVDLKKITDSLSFHYLTKKDDLSHKSLEKISLVL